MDEPVLAGYKLANYSYAYLYCNFTVSKAKPWVGECSYVVL